MGQKGEYPTAARREGRKQALLCTPVLTRLGAKGYFAKIARSPLIYLESASLKVA